MIAFAILVMAMLVMMVAISRYNGVAILQVTATSCNLYGLIVIIGSSLLVCAQASGLQLSLFNCTMLYLCRHSYQKTR